MMYLQVSGKLDQYINVHYRYLAILSRFYLLFGFSSAVFVGQNGKAEEKAHEHDHDHGLSKPYQRGIAYVLLALPVIVGTLFPTVSLDTTIVEAKGFNFPVSKESVGDPEMQTQYLKPDTSIYFNKSDYLDQMNELKEKYGDKQTIKITDENYLEVMELIYNYPSEFIGKKSAMKDLFTKHRTIAIQISSCSDSALSIVWQIQESWFVDAYAGRSNG